MAGITASITRAGTYEPFELQVARGQIGGHRAVTVFGYNPSFGTTEETVWPDGGIIPFPSSAIQMTVSSSSTADTAVGTGARTVTISGLGANYVELSETVTLNGQTAVTTVNSYLRINSMSVATTGTGLANAGIIYIGTGTVTTGVPATIYNLISIGYNQTTTGHYTVPAGYNAFLLGGDLTNSQGTGQPITGRLTLAGPDGIRRTGAITTFNSGQVVYNFKAPLYIPSTYDLDASVVGAGTGNAASSTFNLILVAVDSTVTQPGQ